MNPEENITDQTLSGEEKPQADGAAAVESKEENPSTSTTPEQSDGDEGQKPLNELSLEDLNQTLGKNFSSKDEALKSIKDTFGYVGKKQEDVSKDLKEQGYMTKQEFENELFYRDNPEHANNKDILDSIAKTKQISLSEAAKTESYNKLFEGASNFEKEQSKKSVLETNPKLAHVEDRQKTVQELSQAGSRDAAAREAAKTVIEAYEL